LTDRQNTLERFEYKYWVPDPLATEFVRLAAPFLRRDAWEGGGQRNTSLYLDTRELEFMRQHTESAPDRFKLRVRAYGDPLSGPAFFEIKRKVKAVTIKRRAVIPLDAVPGLLGAGPGVLPPLKSAEDERTLAHFLYLMTVYQAEPRVLVTCRREAYTAADPDEPVRVTLDRDIWYQPAQGPSLEADPRAWVPLCGHDRYQAAASTLIEIKFRGVAPWWIDGLVQRLGLSPSAYSKYVAAMGYDELGAAVLDAFDLAPAAAPLAEKED
jgi:hypothetical protein